MGEGAFLGLLKKSTKDRIGSVKGEGSDSGPPSDGEAGEEYSKVGDEAVDEVGEDTEASTAFASLADAMGIPQEKRARAQAALHSYVKACSRGSDISEE